MIFVHCSSHERRIDFVKTRWATSCVRHCGTHAHIKFVVYRVPATGTRSPRITYGSRYDWLACGTLLARRPRGFAFVA